MSAPIVLAAAGILTLGGYIGACWLWPYAACPRCDGRGRRMSPTRKRWGNCRRCGGSGRQYRRGRRLWNWAHRNPDKPAR